MAKPQGSPAARGAPPAHPHVEKALQYARDVVAGRIVAGKLVIAACQRQLDNLARENDPAWPYLFDRDKAEKACRFVEALPHVKGEWARKKIGDPRAHLIKLEPWQCFAQTTIFGWVKKSDGYRRFNLAMICVARKNGKSAIASGTGLYMLCADGEIGPEVYCGATTEAQAWEVFRPAKKMCEDREPLRTHFGIEVNASSIIVPRTSGRMLPIIGKPGDGSSPSCAIVDEYHEHKTADQFNTMQTGMGARHQPLMFVITTAGDNTAGPCYGLWQDVVQIVEGVIVDETVFGLIYTLDPGDDYADPAVLPKANPNIGVSVLHDFLAARQAEAIRNQRQRNRFIVKHLNVWVNARAGFFDMPAWQRSADPVLKLEDFEGRPCFLGLDLASKVDITALEILFPPAEPDGDWIRFGLHYLPEDTIQQAENEHYRDWHANGWLIATDGNVTDYERIHDDILELTSRFEVKNVGYDPHQATMLVTRLMASGVPVTEYRPMVLNFSEPMKQLDAWIRAERVKHDGNPCMAWQMANVTAKEDAKDNVYPRKEQPEKKIDGPVALITAVGVALAAERDGGAFAYDDGRDLLVI